MVDVNGWIENGRAWVFRGGRGVQQKEISCVEIGESPLANLVKALFATTGRYDGSREITQLLSYLHRLAGAARVAEICLYGYFKRFVAKRCDRMKHENRLKAGNATCYLKSEGKLEAGKSHFDPCLALFERCLV